MYIKSAGKSGTNTVGHKSGDNSEALPHATQVILDLF